MRVISGSAKGAKLIAPEGLETRPTSDRIKESLFNMISFDLYDAKFLDLFSGSGGIGIEALSRGAKQAVFVDSSKEAYQCIKNNLNKTRFLEKSLVLNTTIEQALTELGSLSEQFDIIFMDPPYNKDMIDSTINLIVKNSLLSQEGYIIVERASSHITLDYNNLKVWKEKKYKTTTMSFLKGTKVK